MELREVQLIQLDILKSVLALLEKHQLTYFAIGGTALGAMRHQGFIPWDDDIDIGMPRKDYEFFCEIAGKELPGNLKIINYKTDANYRYYITRVQNKEHKIVEKRNKEVEKFTYISIDVFPLDGFPKQKLKRNFHVFSLLTHRMMMSLGYAETIDKERKRNIFEQALIYFFCKVKVNKLINPLAQKEKIDYLLKKYSYEEENLVGNFMGAYRTREIVYKDYFGDGIELDFEDIKIKAPKDIDVYLEHMYGDYMKIPSEKEIQSKQHFEEWKGA